MANSAKGNRVMAIEVLTKTVAIQDPAEGLAVVDGTVTVGVVVHSGYGGRYLNVFVKIGPDEFDELAAFMLRADPSAATQAFKRAVQADQNSN
jgi:hypothetical protein